jgi:hypothetical protein
MMLRSIPNRHVILSKDANTTHVKVVATYSNCELAQSAGNRLGDALSPVEYVEVVGRDLHLAEYAHGRLTTARAVADATAIGVWIGLFVGLPVGLFTSGMARLGLALGAVLIGASWGAVFGFVGQLAERRNRDVLSLQSPTTGRRDVKVVEREPIPAPVELLDASSGLAPRRRNDSPSPVRFVEEALR